MKDNIIEICNLKKKYDGFELNIPKLYIGKGQCIGLIGENGAGKSTLIKLILQLIGKDSGEILIFGDTIVSKQTKKEISVVFDTNNYNGNLTINELNIILNRIFGRKWDEKKYFNQVMANGLPREKKIDTFSLGMKAKLNIIIAFSHNPRILILDEATSNLDPVVRIEINNIIKQYIRDTGCTVVFSSHIVNELEEIADRLLFLRKGKIALDTTPYRLRNNYRLIKIKDKKLLSDDMLAVERNEGYYLCLTDNIKDKHETEIVKQGVSTGEVLYYLAKGVL
ncbi:ABC transporter ATP-binding protein [Butyrivibrio sp. M55]|uniref:ATP binding protein BviB n=1 Tax=Butyrivibrio fibrisolvens TaxID=831 RepID=Q9ZGP8_BUTFI|nr:ABC transporter ATP-binding protein [Butyrivibrio sp. M55]AAC69557.2 ATP binding protein BviB [Butyrivibrio fibrisolvens]SFU95307.1 ABC-2 type transport system ATP-binding protein [Butyrivibrio sp. M55]